MSAVFMFLSLSHRTGGRLKQTSFFLLDTQRMIFDFAKAIDHRREQADEIAFEWTEPAEANDRAHLERNLSHRDCFSPDAVLPGLRFLKQLAASKDRDIRELWQTLRQRLKVPATLTPSAFDRRVASDLDGLIRFCEEAQERGDLIVSILVP